MAARVIREFSPLAGERGYDAAMTPLGDYCLDQNQEIRVLNALWRELYPASFKRPLGWHPAPEQVVELRLAAIFGLGFLGQEIVKLWLSDNGHPQPRPKRGPARNPIWQSRDRRRARLKPLPRFES